MAKLKVVAFHRGKNIYENTHTLPVKIGRTPQNDVVLEQSFISRTHCHIFEEDGKYFLEDLNSSNGIYLFDKKISKIEVTDDFDFRLGEIEVHVEFEKEVEIHEPNEEVSKVPFLR
jgi:pSer/pThr/pTyr-binding forkhead associated (FHA) protein